MKSPKKSDKKLLGLFNYIMTEKFLMSEFLGLLVFIKIFVRANSNSICSELYG